MDPICGSHGTRRCSYGSRRWLRILLVVTAVVSVLGIGAWANREWFLRSVADLWIVSDPLGPADAVAVFGGGLADRPFAAAQYYRQGLVKKVLVSNAGGVYMPDVAATEGILLKLGVPASAIETFGNDPGNTN